MNVGPSFPACVWGSLCVYFLHFQATHKSYSHCFDHSLVFPHYEEGHLYIKRFYSPSKSFLKIEPKSEMLSCGSPTEVRVHYILTPEAVGEERKIVFYYLVSLHFPYSQLVTGNCRGGGDANCGLRQQALNTSLSSSTCSFPMKRRVKEWGCPSVPWVSTGILLQGGRERLSRMQPSPCCSLINTQLLSSQVLPL